jgi:hypothetical protein
MVVLAAARSLGLFTPHRTYIGPAPSTLAPGVTVPVTAPPASPDALVNGECIQVPADNSVVSFRKTACTPSTSVTITLRFITATTPEIACPKGTYTLAANTPRRYCMLRVS